MENALDQTYAPVLQAGLHRRASACPLANNHAKRTLIASRRTCALVNWATKKKTATASLSVPVAVKMASVWHLEYADAEKDT